MKDNKRGFTLIELLAVIVILSILILLAVPTVLKILKDYRYKTYLRQKEILINATEKYLAQDANNIVWNDGEAEVSLSKLQEEGIMGNKVNNPITNDAFGRGTRITATKTESGIYYRVSEEFELTYQFTKEKAGEEGTFEYYNGSNRYRGSNPNNWLRFGQDSEGNNLMWRVVRWDEEGIKIIYEGKENNGEVPIDDGRIKIDGDYDIAWNENEDQSFDKSILKSKLATWYNNLNINKDYIQPVNWCVGPSGERLVQAEPSRVGLFQAEQGGQQILSKAKDNILSQTELDGLVGLRIGAEGLNINRKKNIGNSSLVFNECKSKTKKETGYGLITAGDSFLLSSLTLLNYNGSLIAMADNNFNFINLISRAGDDAAGIASNYLLKGEYSYWTLTLIPGPIEIESGIEVVKGVSLETSSVTETYSVRPVLNLKSSIYGCGNGTLGDPYQPSLQKVLCLLQ